MGPASPSLEEASCPPGGNRFLGVREGVASFGGPHPLPRIKKVSPEKVAGLGILMLRLQGRSSSPPVVQVTLPYPQKVGRSHSPGKEDRRELD